MTLHNFNSVYSMANIVYGIHVDPTNFEDIALLGWELIGNKHTRLYRYTTSTTDKRIKLPCNLVEIESVTIPYMDAQMYTNTSNFPNVYNQYVERYIEAWKWDNATIYEPGKLIKYREEGDELVFDRDFSKVIILYHGVIADDEGLPLLNDKEVRALALYLVYSDTYKQALARKDGNLLQLALATKGDWLKACTAARIPNVLTQNDMNAILDVKTRWDRKQYGKSFKPIL